MMVLGFRTPYMYIHYILFAKLYIYYSRNKFFLHNPRDMPNTLPDDKIS